jgi:hypothetical protein
MKESSLLIPNPIVRYEYGAKQIDGGVLIDAAR